MLIINATLHNNVVRLNDANNFRELLMKLMLYQALNTCSSLSVKP